MVIDCVETVASEQFKTVSDTLKSYNSMIMLQSKSGLKINNIDGEVTFIHGKLAREENEFIKPILVINQCNQSVKVSTRINLEVRSKSCKQHIIRFNQ